MTTFAEYLNESVKIDFDTNKYQASHGKPPKGRGSWIFAEKGGRGSSNEIVAPGSMTYLEAKKWLKKKLSDEGVTGSFTVYVMP